MKSFGSKNEGSIPFHRSEPPMNNLHVQKTDNSQSEENNDVEKDDLPYQKSNCSVGDGNTVTELRTLNSNSNDGSSVQLLCSREENLSDPVELEANNGNLQTLSSISAACSSIRILPDFLIEHARPVPFRSVESESRSPSTKTNAGPLSDSDSNQANSKLHVTSDLTFNSVLTGQSWVSGSANNYYHNSNSAQNSGLNNLASLSKISWRKGKWIDEEGVYTKKLIEAFNAGLLKIPSGTTLRSFLAEQLRCDPMRITKKFARSSAIGKQVFVPCDLTKTDPKVLKEVQDELNELGEKFRAKVELAQSSCVFPINTQAALAAAMRGVQGRTAPYFEGLPSDVLRNLVLAQQNQLIRNSLIHTGQIPSHADAANLQLASHGLPDMATLSSLCFGSTPLSPLNGASSSSTSSSTLNLREGDRVIPKQSVEGAPTVEKNEADIGTNVSRGENKDPQPVVGSSLASDAAVQFISRIADHHELAGQFLKPLTMPPASKPEKKLPSTSLNLNASTVSLANISKSLYETQLNESQSQAMKHNQTFGTGLINMTNFPYDLLYNQSPKYSDSNATEVKKPRKERKSSKCEVVDGNGNEGMIKAANGSKRQPATQQQSHPRKSENDKSSISCHTQQQQQQLLSKLQQEIFNNASKKSSVGEEKAKSKSTNSKKYSREHSSSSLNKQESASNKDQLSNAEQQLQQHNGDLYASDLLMNFFKAANHSPMSGEKPVFSDSSQFHGENGDRDDYVNGKTMMRESNDRNLTSDSPMKSGMEKLPSNNNNNNTNASNGTCSDSGESNGNGHGPHKMNSKSHTTSESDSSTSTSGNEEHDQDRDRKSSSSPSSMADEAPRVSAKDRTASGNTDRSKRKLTAAAVSAGDLQDTGSDHKSSDLTNNSQSVSDEESTDSSTRFEIDVSNSNSSNDLKDGHFDGNRIDVEESALKHVNSSNNICSSGSGSITGSINPNTANNNIIIISSSSSKKRSRTTFQRSDVEEDNKMLIVESDEYCTLDTLQSQGETIDSNARKKLVNRLHSSPTNPASKLLLESNKSKSAYDSGGPASSVE